MSDQHPWQKVEILRRVRTGITTGATMGALLIAVGLIRAVLAILFGHSVSTDGARDLVGLALYVGGFAAAGGLLGALWPMRRSFLGRFLLGYLGAGLVCAVCGVIVMQLENDHDPMAYMFVVGIMTLIFGTALGHWLRSAD